MTALRSVRVVGHFFKDGLSSWFGCRFPVCCSLRVICCSHRQLLRAAIFAAPDYGHHCTGHCSGSMILPAFSSHCSRFRPEAVNGQHLSNSVAVMYSSGGVSHPRSAGAVTRRRAIFYFLADPGADRRHPCPQRSARQPDAAITAGRRTGYHRGTSTDRAVRLCPKGSAGSRPLVNITPAGRAPPEVLQGGKRRVLRSATKTHAVQAKKAVSAKFARIGDGVRGEAAVPSWVDKISRPIGDGVVEELCVAGQQRQRSAARIVAVLLETGRRYGFDRSLALGRKFSIHRGWSKRSRAMRSARSRARRWRYCAEKSGPR
jgi:hypothetical protein